MCEPTRLLIIEYHPMTIIGYRTSIEEHIGHDNIIIDEAKNCSEAYSMLFKNTSANYEIILLGIDLPPCENLGLLNGEDLGLKIKKKFPKTKILVLTMYNNKLRIQSILKNLNPDGLMLKSEIVPNKLKEAYSALLNNENYYSKKVTNLLSKYISKNTLVDSIDQKILYYISLGEKMKNLPKYIPLSMPSIERRKKNLSSTLGIETGSDRQLLAIAKKKGFL